MAENTDEETKVTPDDHKVTLSKPIISFGEKVKEFTLSEPCGKDIRRIGAPIIFTADGGYDFDMDRVAKWVAVLATPKLTPNAVDQVAPGDWLPMAAALIPFFMASTPSA